MPGDDDSSDRMNTPGKACSRPRRITASARRSASVSGDESGLEQDSMAPAYTAMTSRLAISAILQSSSSSPRPNRIGSPLQRGAQFVDDLLIRLASERL